MYNRNVPQNNTLAYKTVALKKKKKTVALKDVPLKKTLYPPPSINHINS